LVSTKAYNKSMIQTHDYVHDKLYKVYLLFE